MEIITQRQQIQELIGWFNRNYDAQATISTFDGNLWVNRKKEEILAEINALDLNVASVLSVARLIGVGSSWYACNECDSKDERVLIRVGDEPDYDVFTAWLCRGCLHKAVELFEAEIQRESQ
jgi:hypothetical protein